MNVRSASAHRPQPEGWKWIMHDNEIVSESSSMVCGDVRCRCSEESSLRPFGVMGLILCVALLAFAWFKRKHTVQPLIRRSCWTIYALLFLLSVFSIIYPARMDRWELCCKVVWYCYGLVEPNVINHAYHFSDHNPDIIIPLSDQGGIVESVLPTDLWVELGNNGRISIHNAAMTKTQLGMIIKNRAARLGHGDYRVFIWADKDASTNAFNDLVLNLTANGCTHLYRVVASPRDNSQKVDYKAVGIEIPVDPLE